MKLYWSKKDMKWVETPQHVPQSQTYLQSDWEPVESPIDGKVYSGRAAYLEHVKASGGHIREPGDTKPLPKPNRQEIRAAVKQSLRELGVTGG